jgi:5-methylcytosine-specific restriction endonuclease McrA
MDSDLRNLVRRRAEDRCEYCRGRQADEPFHSMHIEHIVARQHGGDDSPENLALACHHCNLHKGPNLTTIDPATGNLVLLFNPRKDVWEEHFAVREAIIVGLSQVGRATVHLLSMNSARRVELRSLTRS